MCVRLSRLSGCPRGRLWDSRAVGFGRELSRGRCTGISLTFSKTAFDQGQSKLELTRPVAQADHQNYCDDGKPYRIKVNELDHRDRGARVPPRHDILRKMALESSSA